MKKQYNDGKFNPLTIGKLDKFSILDYIILFDKYIHKESLNDKIVDKEINFARMELKQKEHKYNLIKFYEFDDKNDRVEEFYKSLNDDPIENYKIE